MLVSSFGGLGKVAVSTCSLTKEVDGGPNAGHVSDAFLGRLAVTERDEKA